MIYIGISFYLVRTTGDNGFWFLGLFGLLACFMQSTFFVFYLVSYTSRIGSYDKNRVDESITEEDLALAEENKMEFKIAENFCLGLWLAG